MDLETIEVVQDACDHFAEQLGIDKVTLVVNSGARCKYHNIAVGGADDSQHPKARAMDIRIVGVSSISIYSYLDTRYPDRYGVGLYQTFVHIDTRSNGPARW